MQDKLIILGATGSVGRTTAEVVEALDGRVDVEGLVAHQNGPLLYELGQRLGARWVALTDEAAGRRLRLEVSSGGPAVRVGMEEVLAAIAEAEACRVVGAMVGFSGLRPTLAAVARGMDVLLANKETLVAAGELVMAEARRSGSHILPVDSEHSALFQCLGERTAPFRRLILTCSGGPFRGRTRRDLAAVTAADALRHPTWNMGAKITIDSATLMNKGLEIIEAHFLFDAPYRQIDVVIHPESIVHSLVEFEDGATMAQLGYPDMRVPVAVALAWPERWPLPVPGLDLTDRTLRFERLDAETFPGPGLARRAGEAGGLWPCVLNAANEVAVAAFLAGRIAYLDIVSVIEETLNRFRDGDQTQTLEAILAADAWARVAADEVIASRG